MSGPQYQNTIQELSSLGSPAVPFLIRAVTNNRETLSVRLGTARALGEIRDERAIASLLRVCNLTNEEGDSLDYLIVPELAKFGAAALPALVTALTDPTCDLLIRAAAAWALGMLGEAHALELLVKRLRDANETNRVRSWDTTRIRTKMGYLTGGRGIHPFVMLPPALRLLPPELFLDQRRPDRSAVWEDGCDPYDRGRSGPGVG